MDTLTEGAVHILVGEETQEVMELEDKLINNMGVDITEDEEVDKEGDILHPLWVCNHPPLIRE